MVRKLAIAVLTMSALSSGVAKALGLGEAKVYSSLNQPLNAEIELVSVRDLTESEILTNLASREAFQRANLDRVYFLSDLRFKVLFKDGKAYVRVTSSKPVREPYLNFLMEVTWPSGRLLREYALLIDPPTFSSESVKPAQVAPARTTTASAPATTTRPSTSTTTTRTTAPSSSSTYDAPSTSGSYGPTGGDDTLWEIALKTRPDSSVSPQQMMLAIQDLNPDAFFDSNINKLKSGQVLRIPDMEQIQQRSNRDAVRQVSLQNREFAEGRAPSTRQVDASGTGRSQTGSAASQTDEDKLRIIVSKTGENASTTPEKAGESTGSRGGTSKTAEELSLAQEKLDQVSRENEDLKSRMEDLQSQLETMQRLVSLKDDQLAALQSKVGETGGDTTAPTLPEEPVMPGDEGMLPGEEPMTPSEPSMGLGDEPSTMGEGTPMSPGMETPEDQAGMNAPETPEPVAPVTPVEPEQPPVAVDKKPPTPAVTEPTPQPEPESWIDIIKNNVIYQAAIGGGAVLLLLILWLLARRGGKKEAEADDEALDIADHDNLALDLDIEAEDGEGEAKVGGDDPIAEADVYIAYQRFDQAVQVLDAALEENPNNQEYRLKLLEVLGEAKEGARFNETYNHLREAGNTAIVNRADEIKSRFSDLDDEPGLSLDDLESQLLGGDDFASSTADDDELDLDLDANLDATVPNQPSALSEPEELEPVEEAEDNLDIDFDLSEIDLGETDKDEVEEAESSSGYDKGIDYVSSKAPAEEESLEDSFETADDSLESLEEDGFELADAEELESDFELDTVGLDDDLETLDLESDLSDELLDMDAPVESDELDESLDLDMNLEEEEPSLDLDDSDLDLSLDEQPAESKEFTGAELSSDVAEEFVQQVDDLEDELPDLSASFDEEPKADVSAELDTDLDFNLDDDFGDKTIVQPQEPAPSVAAESKPAAKEGMQDEFVEELEEDFNFLSDTDEAATKLDLARAYIDMGDREGARDILEEVVEEGNNDQKQEAASLLKRLA
ncbi:FimV/HubP family polar landmark protein [Hahella aquimaris]|uniref:FimV/HubP family polar landmark protein n=1 Tax=Hahella sp. HNIBRBA332 TaxID=3015983 RepID=UPI00273C83D5|nr:FimV/HubP family polar landmark protein [Hahella sp. HNIBRBA332]WLQ15491.1 FimV/HubP family polar landmark protein [Hahella sp. HNIBRBA332]